MGGWNIGENIFLPSMFLPPSHLPAFAVQFPNPLIRVVKQPGPRHTDAALIGQLETSETCHF